MQALEHINFTNSPTFAANPGAHTAKAVELYRKLNADEVEALDKTGVIKHPAFNEAVEKGFDSFALAAAIRHVHSLF